MQSFSLIAARITLGSATPVLCEHQVIYFKVNIAKSCALYVPLLPCSVPGNLKGAELEILVEGREDDTRIVAMGDR